MIEIPVVILESFFKSSLCCSKIKLKIFVFLAVDISFINNIWCEVMNLEGTIFSVFRQLQRYWLAVRFNKFLLCPEILWGILMILTKFPTCFLKYGSLIYGSSYFTYLCHICSHTNVIQFTKQITEISNCDITLRKQSRKTILFNEKISWV